VVLSNNDGCSIARSDAAKALGFAMGDPYHLIQEKLTLHGVQVLSSNDALDSDMRRRVMETLGAFTPDVEISSIQGGAGAVRRPGRGEAAAPGADGGPGHGFRHDQPVLGEPTLLCQPRDGSEAAI
jgi:hypothetical protein